MTAQNHDYKALSLGIHVITDLIEAKILLWNTLKYYTKTN